MGYLISRSEIMTSTTEFQMLLQNVHVSGCNNMAKCWQVNLGSGYLMYHSFNLPVSLKYWMCLFEYWIWKCWNKANDGVLWGAWGFSWLSDQFLILAEVMNSVSWDQVSGRAPCSAGRMLLALSFCPFLPRPTLCHK